MIIPDDHTRATVELESVRDLLGELLGRFNMAPAAAKVDEERRERQRLNKPESKQRKVKAQGAAPLDPWDYARLSRKEILAARPLLEKLVVQTRELLRVVREPTEYGIRRRAIIDAWNEAIATKQWLTLPGLCATCNVPVLVRGDGEGASFFCSDVCRRRESSRVSRTKTRARKKLEDE